MRLGPAVCASLLLAGAAGAQVVSDGSLGPAGPVDLVGTTWQITEALGERSGSNLYHSFSLFDVAAGQTASFQPDASSPPTTDAVIARVTGGSPSQIGGRIQSLYEGADLYLLNPSGLSFGPASAVQALGSVAVSTADVLRFGGDPAFDARSAAAPAALSADAPTAFGFLSSSPAPIAFDLDSATSGFDFPLPDGETFTAVGGDVTVDGWSGSTGSRPTLRISGGSIQLAAVAAAGVDVPVDVASFDARGQAAGRLGTVSLGRNALLDVGSPAGAPVGSGQVVIRAGRFVIDDARIQSIAGSALDGAPVAVDVEVAESAVIQGGSRLSTASAAASSGDLRLSAASVEIRGAGTRLEANASGSAQAPDVRVEAGSFHLGEGARITTLASQPDPSGAGGLIAIEADRAIVDGGAFVRSASSSSATGGAIVVDAGEVHVTDGLIRSESTADGTGGAITVRGGDLRIESVGQIASENTKSGRGGAIGVDVGGDVIVSGRGSIIASATGTATGAGGDVSVEAGRSIQVSGEDSTGTDVAQIAALTSSSSPSAQGGTLHVSAPLIELRDAGQLRTTTDGAGRGGLLEVVDTDLLRAVGNANVGGKTPAAGVFARTTASDVPGPTPETSFFAGDSGGIEIAARVVEVLDGAEISTRSLGSGDAGPLHIVDAERVSVRGGERGRSTLSTKGAQGAGADLEITAGVLEIASGADVSASSVGGGDAGDVRVAAERISISDGGLFAQTTFAASNSGNAGNVNVDVGERLEVRSGGRISVDSNGGGAAGDVTITGSERATIALVGGSVSAESSRNAAAGNVRIDAGRRFVAGRGARVATTAEENASGGQVAISAREIVYASDARIETRVDFGSAGGAGDGGDVDVPGAGSAPPVFSVLNRSQIVATTFDGVGGNIRVAARDLIASQGVVIDPTALGGGVSGTVEITGPDADLAGQIVPLPANFLDAAKLMTTACAARRARTGSFVVQTRDAVSPSPDAPVTPGELMQPGGAQGGSEAGDAPCPG